MNYIVKKISLLIAIIVFTSVNAQSSISFLGYKEALHIVNPAQVGSTEKVEVMALIRNKNMDVPNSPQTQFFSLAVPLGKNMSGGLSIVNDSYHITRETHVFADASYKMKLDETKNLFFGLKMGWTSLNIDTQSLGKNNDNSLNTPVNRPFNFNFGTGMYLKAKKYYIGLSIPKFLHTKRFSQDDKSSNATDINQIYFNTGYILDISTENMQMSLIPSLMLRHDVSVSTVAELGAVFQIMNKFEVGVSNRFKESYGVLTMFKFLDKYKVGYGFESYTSELGGSSHQFTIRATF